MDQLQWPDFTPPAHIEDFPFLKEVKDHVQGKHSTGFGQSDLHSLIDHLKAIYEDSVVNKIVPLLMQALEEKMADQFLHGGDTRLEHVDLQDMLPRHEESQPSVRQKNKGKGRAIVPVS